MNPSELTEHLRTAHGMEERQFAGLDLEYLHEDLHHTLRRHTPDHTHSE